MPNSRRNAPHILRIYLMNDLQHLRCISCSVGYNSYTGELTEILIFLEVDWIYHAYIICTPPYFYFIFARCQKIASEFCYLCHLKERFSDDSEARMLLFQIISSIFSHSESNDYTFIRKNNKI